MFYFPSTKDLEELRAFNGPCSVTIYAPLIQETGGINPNKLQLKNLLREAERRLTTEGLEPRLIRKTTGRARKLLEQNNFWHLREAGLTLFMHSNYFRCYRLPGHDIPYLVTIAQEFNLEPLLRVLDSDRTYYVLAVSHNQVRFFQGGHYAIKEIIIKNLPTNLKDDLRLDEHQRWSETHAVAPASRVAHSEAFHSQSNQKEIDKEELFQFFRHIDSRLHKYLKGKKTPLIFAGVDYLAPIFRKANTYPHLVPEAIKGNSERKDLNLLREQCWRLLSKREVGSRGKLTTIAA